MNTSDATKNNDAGWSVGIWRWPLVVLGLIVMLALIIKFSGADPKHAFKIMLEGAVGSAVGWSETLARFGVLCLLGLSVALSFRAGIFNIGAEGQFLMGGLAAAAFATIVLPESIPSVLGVPSTLMVGALGGVVWSAIAGFLKVWKDISEVISTLMLNWIAFFLLHLMVNHDYLLGKEGSAFPVSAEFPEGASLPGWGATSFHSGIFWVFPIVVVVFVVQQYSRAGMKIRLVGLNEDATRAIGLDVKKIRMGVFAGSGALAGFAGAMAVMAVGYLSKGSPYPEYGYMAIAVALVGLLHPLAIVPSALMFAALEAGAKEMDRQAGVPSEVVYLIQGVVVLVLLSSGLKLPGSKSGANAAGEVRVEA